LPNSSELEHLISVCYQTSLLHDEERPVRFRLIFLAPDRLPANQGPPTGLHGILFADPPPFTERELRKLSPSVDFYGSLIGLWRDEKNGFSIWVIVHSGSRWAQSLHGGGKGFHPLPGSLVINVISPGRITVNNGSTEVGTLNSGKIVSPSCSSHRTICSVHRVPRRAAHIPGGMRRLRKRRPGSFPLSPAIRNIVWQPRRSLPPSLRSLTRRRSKRRQRRPYRLRQAHGTS
jgi:hypothetical protein